jgi:hypothetical protein
MPPSASGEERPAAKVPKLGQTKLVFGSAMGIALPKTALSPAAIVATVAATPFVGSTSTAAGSSPAGALSTVKRERVGTTIDEPVIKLKLRIVPGTTAVVADVAVSMQPPATLQAIKKKRRSYSGKEKAAAVEAVASLVGSMSSKAKALARTDGYDKVRGDQLRKWETPTVAMKRGPKVNLKFEQAVLDQLVYTQVAELDDASKVGVVANVAYSYAVVEQAAKAAQRLPEFADDGKLQKLKFTPPWIKSFLDRSSMHRRVVSTTDKVLPSIEEVQSTMADIAETKTSGDFRDDETISADETAVLYGLQPKNQYVPEGDGRGSAPASDEKARYTSMQAGEGEGGMLPSFNIIKCSPTKADLTSTRVLKDLHKVSGFTAADGWEFLVWTRTLTLLDKKKKEFTAEYKRPYLKHTATGAVITIQHKAWMDTAGICMWADVLIGPYFARKRGKCLLIWDNCGSHCVPAVGVVLKEWGITEKKLPKNMTGKLQIMDLVVNGPYKAAIRRKRVAKLFDYFQSWKIKRLQEMAKPPAERELPAFEPPKPTLAVGLLQSFEVERELFAKASFKAAIKKTFMQAGQTPKADGTFITYKSHTTQSISACLLPEGKTESHSLATIVGTTDVITYEEDEEPETDEEDKDDE